MSENPVHFIILSFPRAFILNLIEERNDTMKGFPNML